MSQPRVWSNSGAPKHAAGAPVLSICDPSGSGKSTVARSFLGVYPTYIEVAEENPHLRALLEGSKAFDAFSNQSWFLRRLAAFIQAADNKRPLILDQEPGAIVLAYSRLFRGEALIGDADYAALLQRLLKLERLLEHWNSPRVVLFLDAPCKVLHQRALQRWGESRTPPLAWFGRVRECFRDLLPHLPNAVTVSTVDLTPGKLIARARQLLEGHSAVEKG